MKPIGLFAYQIKNSSAKGDHVLDTFGGSGTTLMACEQLDRTAHLVELDPRYVDVIVRRYVTQKGNSEGVYLVREGQRMEYSEAMNS